MIYKFDTHLVSIEYIFISLTVSLRYPNLYPSDMHRIQYFVSIGVLAVSLIISYGYKYISITVSSRYIYMYRKDTLWILVCILKIVFIIYIMPFIQYLCLFHNIHFFDLIRSIAAYQNYNV